jgi:hypothetical protein
VTRRDLVRCQRSLRAARQVAGSQLP